MKTETSEWSLKNYATAFESSAYEQTSLSPRYTESLMSFSHDDVINGNISTFITPDIEVSKLSVRSALDLSVFQCDNTERYISTTLFKGNMQAHYPEFKTQLDHGKERHTFLHLREADSKHTLAAGETSILYLNVKPETMHSFMPSWEEQKEKLSDKTFRNRFYTSPPLSIHKNMRLQQAMLSLNNNAFGGITRSLFMEAKAMELLALQLEEIIQNSEGTTVATTISKSDYDKLMAMYEYINEHYLEPLSLTMLARQFLLNEFILKKGFKQLFKQSAFNYIHTLRMEKAKELLQSGDRMVNEVSDMVGYSSIHNFSNAFYKMYNYRPSRIKPEEKKVMINS